MEKLAEIGLGPNGYRWRPLGEGDFADSFGPFKTSGAARKAAKRAGYTALSARKKRAVVPKGWLTAGKFAASKFWKKGTYEEAC